MANPETGRDYHVAHGFPERKRLVVPNGIDTARFRPIPQARARLYSEWGLPEDAVLIGLVARLDPQKDHATFLRAAAALSRDHPGARFVCVGTGPKQRVADLRRLAQELGVAEKVIWAGLRKDMPEVLSSLDIATSSSAFGEGFSNAIGEAMAAGVPCVVTGVGDSAAIVGDTGVVVGPRDAEALAQGWRRLLSLSEDERRALGCRSRERVLQKFSTRAMVDQTAALCRRLVRDEPSN